MTKTSISLIAYYLALIGGILMVILGLLSLLEISIRGPYLYWSVVSGLPQGGVVMLICGIIAIIGAKSTSRLIWAIILIIVGIIGGGLGGLLVILGGIVGLIASSTKKPWYKR